MTKENVAVTNFREYLRIKTVHPDPDYDGAIAWLRKQANELKLEFNIVRFPPPGEFAVYLTWKGAKGDELKSILLNSHIDVVPVDISKWSYDPFEAVKTPNGNIYARGAQDMKCVGVQYLEAIRQLKAKGLEPLRNVHISFVPDEEVGSFKGMALFVKTPEFKSLRVGFALDEGMANPGDSYYLFYGERPQWQLRVTAKGQTGHASILHENTAAEKLHKVITKFLNLRESEKARLKASTDPDLGAVTSVNMTMLDGGLQANVVPPELSAVFDIRISPNWSLDYMNKLLKDTCKEAGPDVTYEMIQHSHITAQTPVDDSNVWWTTFKEVADTLKLKLNKKIFPVASDARWVRNLGIPAFGFSPMNNTPILLHDHDEFLNEAVFLRGVDIYEALLEKMIALPNDLMN